MPQTFGIASHNTGFYERKSETTVKGLICEFKSSFSRIFGSELIGLKLR